MVFVIIAKGFEDDLEQGEAIFVGFEQFQFGGVPEAEDFSVDGPDEIVEEVGEERHEMLQNVYYFQV